jgi:hypothetical protein
MRMEIRNFKAVNHKTVKANFNIYIKSLGGLHLNKMVLMETSKGTFVSPPSQKYEKDGETNYFPYWGFDKEESKRFQEKVLVLLKPFLAATTESQPEPNSNDSDLPF